MKTRQIVDKINIKSDGRNTFEALIKPSLIKKWWMASSAIVIPEENGLYALSWGDDPDEPDFVTYATIKEIVPSQRLVLQYHSYLSRTEKLPFKTNFLVEFTVLNEDSHCTLCVKQTGFPMEKTADDYYQACVQGWRDSLKWIKITLETKDE